MNLEEVHLAFKSREKIEASVPHPLIPGNREWMEVVITSIRYANSEHTDTMALTVAALGDNTHFRRLVDFAFCDIGTRLRKIDPINPRLAKAEERVVALQNSLYKEVELRKTREDQLDATVKALDLLKKEIGAKANALAGMTVSHITADVICRHVVALRRLM